jgi:hypothetical protein
MTQSIIERLREIHYSNCLDDFREGRRDAERFLKEISRLRKWIAGFRYDAEYEAALAATETKAEETL